MATARENALSFNLRFVVTTSPLARPRHRRTYSRWSHAGLSHLSCAASARAEGEDLRGLAETAHQL
jgi:hypothetical protein